MDHPHLVILGTENADSLRQVLDRLKIHGILYVEFHDTYFGDSLTAAATQPIFEDQRPLFSHFKLLGKEDYVSTSK